VDGGDPHFPPFPPTCGRVDAQRRTFPGWTRTEPHLRFTFRRVVFRVVAFWWGGERYAPRTTTGGRDWCWAGLQALRTDTCVPCLPHHLPFGRYRPERFEHTPAGRRI